jgi:hypothetical protein
LRPELFAVAAGLCCQLLHQRPRQQQRRHQRETKTLLPLLRLLL